MVSGARRTLTGPCMWWPVCDRRVPAIKGVGPCCTYLRIILSTPTDVNSTGDPRWSRSNRKCLTCLLFWSTLLHGSVVSGEEWTVYLGPGS
jgi:hypothetical protein